MKKLYLICVILLIIAFSCIASIKQIGIDYLTSDNFTYKLLEDGTISIIKYNSSNEESIVVPEQINNLNVTYIESKAYDCENVTSIYIGNTISSIAKEAFYNCQNVEIIYFGANFCSQNGFDNLDSLETLHINYGIDGVMNDYNSAHERFYDAYSKQIKEIVINQGVKYLSNYAFANLINLEKITVDDSIQSIGDYAFYNTKINDLYLPLSLTSIGKYAFYNENIINDGFMVIPQKVSYFGENALNTDSLYYVYSDSIAFNYVKDNELSYSEIDLNFTDEVLQLEIGQTFQTSIVNPSIFINQLAYTSENQHILTIDQNGLITTCGNGKTNIYCQSESGFSQLEVNVISDDDSIETIYKKINIKDEIQISLEMFKSLSGKIDDYTIDILDDGIISVDDNGLVKALTRGKTSLYLYNGNRKARIIFDVALNIKTISLDSDVFNMRKGESQKINVKLNPSNVDNSYLSYNSSDPEIAQVNSNGVVTALSNGSCTIEITSNDGSYASASLKINVSTGSISIKTSEIALVKGHYFRTRTSSSDNGKLLYSIADENIAIVDESGKITGVNEGDTLLNITNANHSAYISIPIKVYNAYSYGLDLSEWNGRTYTAESFKKVKDDGIDFVYLRAAFASEKKDPIFERNYEAAKKAGLNIGAYHYITATSVEEAKQQAQFMVQCISGKQFEYPIMVDIEESEHASMSADLLVEIVDAYCQILEDNGYLTCVYSYASILNKINTSRDKWIAHWGTTSPTLVKSEYTLWQTCSCGLVNGLSGNVDCDICFYDYPSYIKNNHLNGY